MLASFWRHRWSVAEAAYGVLSAIVVVEAAKAVWEWNLTMPMIELKPKTPEQAYAKPLYKSEPWPYPGDTDKVNEFMEKRQIVSRMQDTAKNSTIRGKDELRASAIWHKMRQDLAEELVAQGGAADSNVVLNDITSIS